MELGHTFFDPLVAGKEQLAPTRNATFSAGCLPGISSGLKVEETPFQFRAANLTSPSSLGFNATPGEVATGSGVQLVSTSSPAPSTSWSPSLPSTPKIGNTYLTSIIMPYGTHSTLMEFISLADSLLATDNCQYDYLTYPVSPDPSLPRFQGEHPPSDLPTEYYQWDHPPSVYGGDSLQDLLDTSISLHPNGHDVTYNDKIFGNGSSVPLSDDPSRMVHWDFDISYSPLPLEQTVGSLTPSLLPSRSLLY